MNVNVSLTVANVTQIKSGIMISVGCKCKNLQEHHAPKKDYTWNPATCNRYHGEYLASSTDDSVITYDKILNAADTVSTNGSANVLYQQIMITKK